MNPNQTRLEIDLRTAEQRREDEHQEYIENHESLGEIEAANYYNDEEGY